MMLFLCWLINNNQIQATHQLVSPLEPMLVKRSAEEGVEA